MPSEERNTFDEIAWLKCESEYAKLRDDNAALRRRVEELELLVRQKSDECEALQRELSRALSNSRMF